jgi:hypothetical protein
VRHPKTKYEKYQNPDHPVFLANNSLRQIPGQDFPAGIEFNYSAPIKLNWTFMKKGIRCILVFALRALAANLAMLPLFLSPQLLHAQFMSLPVDLSYLSQRADVIVQGKIISVRHEHLPGHQNIPTVAVTLEVEKMLRGPSGNKYTFRETYLGFGLKGGKRNYQAGQRLLLFLPSPSQMGLSSPIGFEQGRFHITRNAGGTEAIANEVGNAGLFKNVEQKASKQGKKLTPAQSKTASIKRGPVRLDDFVSLTKSLMTLPRIR